MAVKVRKSTREENGIQIPLNIRPDGNELVTLIKCGRNHVRIGYSQKRSRGAVIKKLDKDTYVDTRDGTVKQFRHQEKRIDDTKSVAQSLKHLRDKINANTENSEYCRWITLTYKENMTDTTKLYNDFKNFNKRLRKEVGQYEYISMVEPQERGAWHCHVLLIFARKAPYIPNETVRNSWKQGFVNIQALDNVDNVGAYLTAYLGDIPLDEAEMYGINAKQYTIKECEKIDENGNKISKKMLKGARMHFYPAGMHIARYSKGLKNPEVVLTTAEKAEKEVVDMELTYESTKVIEDEKSGFSNVYNIRAYKRQSAKNNGETHEDNGVVSRIPPNIYEKLKS